MYAIDVHAHVFPDHIAEKAVATLSSAADIKPRGKGTVSDLLVKMDNAGVKQSILVSIATRPSQVKTINNWVLSQKSDRLIPFATLHPEDPDRFNEIERIKELGFLGVKLHANYQEFYPDEPRVIDMARAMSDAGLILLMHGGKDWAYEEINASPLRMARLMEAVPGLRIIIAHFGGFQTWNEVEEILAGSPAWFDISFTLPFISQEDFLRIGRKHGINRLLFGADYPWSNAKDDLELFHKLGLTSEEKEAILHINAENLLNL
ncbi:amidohydrolase family protein [Candidatus Sumerlaeota bacterium]|nr:amidohydrolase family protein [Candidatus Sumerlaeota bacterium]